MQLNTSVIVNRPGHFTHGVRGEVAELLPGDVYLVQVREYRNNAQSFQFSSDRILVKAEYLLPTAGNEVQVNQLLAED